MTAVTETTEPKLLDALWIVVMFALHSWRMCSHGVSASEEDWREFAGDTPIPSYAGAAVACQWKRRALCASALCRMSLPASVAVQPTRNYVMILPAQDAEYFLPTSSEMEHPGQVIVAGDFPQDAVGATIATDTPDASIIAEPLIPKEGSPL